MLGIDMELTWASYKRCWASFLGCVEGMTFCQYIFFAQLPHCQLNNLVSLFFLRYFAVSFGSAVFFAFLIYVLLVHW